MVAMIAFFLRVVLMVYANKISSNSRLMIVRIVEEYWTMYSLFVELI